MFMFPYVVGKLHYTYEPDIVFYSCHANIDQAKEFAEKVMFDGDDSYVIFIYDSCSEDSSCLFYSTASHEWTNFNDCGLLNHYLTFEEFDELLKLNSKCLSG